MNEPNTATVHKPDRMVCLKLTSGEAFFDQDQHRRGKPQRQRSIAVLERRAATQGFQMNPFEAAA
jgi:hypothetical protein